MKEIKLYSALCGYRCGNSGDLCSAEIIEKVFQKKVYQRDIHTNKEELHAFGKLDENPLENKLIASGSIVELIPNSFTGYVWGTGLMFEWSNVSTPYTKITSVRGLLTKNRWKEAKNNDVSVGDPGLLVSNLVETHPEVRYKVGIIPHYVDAQNEGLTNFLRWNKDATCIDICGRLEDVLERILECEYIISSSLHGLIFADALGVPNSWIRLSDGLAGGSFKFRDYYSSHGINDPIPYGFSAGDKSSNILAQRVYYERPLVEELQSNLLASFPHDIIEESFVELEEGEDEL
jgi:pyruvyltransferase